MNAVGGLSEFLAKLPASAMEDEVCSGAVGLIGDLAKNIGKPCAPYLPEALVTPILQQCGAILDEDESGPCPKAQDVLGYARSFLTQVHAP